MTCQRENPAEASSAGNMDSGSSGCQDSRAGGQLTWKCWTGPQGSRSGGGRGV